MSSKRTPIKLHVGVYRDGHAVQVRMPALLPRDRDDQNRPRRLMVGVHLGLEINKGKKPGDAMFSFQPCEPAEREFTAKANWYNPPDRVTLAGLEGAEVKAEWGNLENYTLRLVIRALDDAFMYMGWTRGQAYELPAEVHPDTAFVQVRFPHIVQRPLRLIGGR